MRGIAIREELTDEWKQRGAGNQILSNIQDPSKKISAGCNKAFQSFAGVNVYQGNTPNRVDNDTFWKDKGFTATARNKISYDKDFKELDFIINYLRQLFIDVHYKLR